MSDSTEKPPEGRVFIKVLDSSVQLDDHASVRKQNELGDVGYAESQRGSMRSSVDRTSEGSYATNLTGLPVQGEDDTLLACRHVVQCMNLLGGPAWGVPVRVDTADESVDCVSDRLDGSGRLRMQVVRAASAQDLYRDLSETNLHRSTLSTIELSALLAASIRKKIGGIKDEEVRRRLVLVLDANRLPAFAMTEVRTAAIASLLELCRTSGFEQVWVAGPTPELTYRIWGKTE